MSEATSSSSKKQRHTKRASGDIQKGSQEAQKFIMAAFGAAFDGDVEELGLLLSPSKMIGEDQIQDIKCYQDEAGNSILLKCVHGAAARGKEQRSGRFLDCLSLLLSLGVAPATKDNNSRTALHWCVLYGRLDLLAFLHQAGCHFLVFDEAGLSPLHLAIGIQSEKIRNQFIEYFCNFADGEVWLLKEVNEINLF